MSTTRFGMVCVGLWLSGAAAMAQDLAAGSRLAHMQCADCHQVGPNPNGKTSVAPSFVDIASTKGMTQTSIQVFLSTPHAGMPNYILNQPQIADVASYIMSLRPAYRDRGNN